MTEGAALVVVAFLVVCVLVVVDADAVGAAAAVFAFVAAAAAVFAGTTRCGLRLFRGGAGLSSATVNVGDWRLCCCWSNVSLETAKGLGAPLCVDEKTSVNGCMLSVAFFFTSIKLYHSGKEVTHRPDVSLVGFTCGTRRLST